MLNFLDIGSDTLYRTEFIHEQLTEMGIDWAQFQTALDLEEFVPGLLVGFQILDAFERLQDAAHPTYEAEE